MTMYRTPRHQPRPAALLLAAAAPIAFADHHEGETKPDKHPDTKGEAWKPLFSDDLSDAKFPAGIWTRNDDGVLTASEDQAIWSEKKYNDFVLDLEFKFKEGGNSGVFLRVADPKSQVQTGFEVQILDTHGKEKVGAHDCGGVIGTAAPSKNMVRPAGEWNRYVISCIGAHLKVVLNGEQIIDLDLSTSAVKDRPPSGYIGFQDEAKRIWYRNVRIKELDGAPK